jgi:hypothetical protein
MSIVPGGGIITTERLSLLSGGMLDIGDLLHDPIKITSMVKVNMAILALLPTVMNSPPCLVITSEYQAAC